MPDAPFIRDQITLGLTVQRYYNSFSGDGPVYLLASRISIDDGFVFHAWNRPLIIICDHFDGSGGWIDASGEPFSAPEFDRSGPQPGAAGANGVYPWPDTDSSGRPLGPGGNGSPGLPGQGGYGGVPVTLRCRTGVNVSITTKGGNGAPGGAGGNGSMGVNGFQQYNGDPDFPQYEIIPGTAGGYGGGGGAGGSGGNAGLLVVTSIEELVNPVLVSDGGTGGAGGPDGQDGPPGRYYDGGSGETTGNGEADGPASGPQGADGAGQAPQVAIVSPEQFVAIAYQDLQSPDGRNFANYWAPFRLTVGDYYYHYYSPSRPEPDRTTALPRAAREIAAVLELQWNNAEAQALQAQMQGKSVSKFYTEAGTTQEGSGESTGPLLLTAEVWEGGGANALGYSPNLDIIPRFNIYIEHFTRFLPFSVAFLEISIDAFLTATTIDDITSFLTIKVNEARDAVAFQNEELKLASEQLDIAKKHAEFTQQAITDVTGRISAASQAQEDEPFSFGDLAGKLVAVGSAVASIAAAVPSGGVSLVGLVPSIMQIENAVASTLAPIVQSMLTSDADDLVTIAKAYDQLNKDPASVLNSSSVVVNFVSLVKKIGQGGENASPAQVALVQQGVKAVQDNLLAEYEVHLANDRIDAVNARIGRANTALQYATDALASARRGEKDIVALGVSALLTAQAAMSALMSSAFLAQRSLEIYTAAKPASPVLLDTGLVHPDTIRDFQEGIIQPYELAAAVQASWAQAVDIIQMQRTYDNYFIEGKFGQLVFAHNVRGRQQLDDFKSNRTLVFDIDPNQFPAGQAEARILYVLVSLVGARSTGGPIACQVTHGGRYLQKMRDGSVNEQLLLSRRTAVNAFDVELTTAALVQVDPEAGPITTAFWGRGVGGQWTLELLDGGASTGPVALDGLTQVQVWIGYLFSYA